MENQEVLRAAIAILSYLRDHPQAKDSAAGITRWWVHEDREVVEKALKLLLQEDVIIKQRHVYQLAKTDSVQAGKTGLDRTLRRLQRSL